MKNNKVISTGLMVMTPDGKQDLQEEKKKNIQFDVNTKADFPNFLKVWKLMQKLQYYLA